MYRPFTVYRRPTRKKKRYIYYIQFRDEYGRRMTIISSGKTTLAEAEQWSFEQFNREVVYPSPGQKFRDDALTWFLWDQCEYLYRKRNRGYYSRSYAEQQRAYLQNHILPYFGRRSVGSITATDIENWAVALKNRYTAVTANRALTVLKIMLKEAKRRRLIRDNPGVDVEKLPEDSREKGILTLTEFRRLFDPGSFNTIWDQSLFHTTYSEYFKENTHLFDALDFLTELTQPKVPDRGHVPPKRLQLIRRYGLYASRTKGCWNRMPHVAARAPEGWRQSHRSAGPELDSPGFEPLDDEVTVDARKRA